MYVKVATMWTLRSKFATQLDCINAYAFIEVMLSQKLFNVSSVTGTMFCNDDWPHPEGPNHIGWTRTVENSRIVYLQPGDGPETYASPHYRRLVENAIRWVAT